MSKPFPDKETYIQLLPSERHRYIIRSFLQVQEADPEVKNAFKTLVGEMNHGDASAIQIAKHRLNDILHRHFFPEGMPTHQQEQWKCNLIESMMPTIVSELSQVRREYNPLKIEELCGIVEAATSIDPRKPSRANAIREQVAISWLERVAERGLEKTHQMG